MLEPETKSLTNLKVAIVHPWFVGRAGGERVVEEIADLFPQAELFSLIVDRRQLHPALAKRSMTTSFLNKIPFVRKFHRYTLLLQPFALRQFDLRSYDLVITSEAGPAKGVRCSPLAVTICYCHSPMRYLWDMHEAYVATMGWPTRAVFSLAVRRLRRWDKATASGVDHFLANSTFVQARIRRFYERASQVLHPPVNVAEASITATIDDYYLVVGRMVAYKYVELAIAACNQLQRRLLVIGEGPENRRLRAMAGPTVKFLGWVPDSEVHARMAACRALISPALEDFGITMVEAQAHGRPVICLAAGGALDSVRALGDCGDLAPTGVTITGQTVSATVEAIKAFERHESLFDPEAIRAHAFAFNATVFRSRFMAFVEDAIARKRAGTDSKALTR